MKFTVHPAKIHSLGLGKDNHGSPGYVLCADGKALIALTEQGRTALTGGRQQVLFDAATAVKEIGPAGTAEELGEDYLEVYNPQKLVEYATLHNGAYCPVQQH